MRIEQVESGFFKTNTYLVSDEHSGQALLIDPAGDWKKIKAMIQHADVTIAAIVLTHAHYDHVNRVQEAKTLTGAPLLAHEAAASRLKKISLLSLLMRRRAKPAPPPDRLLAEGDVVEVGALRFEVIHTPGHSPGGICLRYKKTMFTGDTLFAGSIGRSDLKGGSWPALKASIEDKLFILSDDIHLYPGHGPKTTIERERKYNIFVKLSPEQLDQLMFGIKPKKKPKEDEGEAAK